MVISKTELSAAIHQYPIIEYSQNIIEEADFQLKGQEPLEIQITHFDHSVQLVIMYEIEETNRRRVVVVGEQRPGTTSTGAKASYNLKIVDLTYLKEKVEKVETKKIVDSYGHTKLITNNIKVLEQNNQ